MIEQLSQLSKTIPLTHSHTPQQFSTLTKNCPKTLLLLSDTSTYFCQVTLIPRSPKHILQGIFHSLHIKIQEHVPPIITHTSGSEKKGDKKMCWRNQGDISANSFWKFVTGGEEGREGREGKEGMGGKGVYNQFVEFDRRILRVFMAMRYDDNYEVLLKEKLLIVDCGTEEWKIPLVAYEDHQLNFQTRVPMNLTINFIKTIQYLTRIETNLQSPSPISPSLQSSLTTAISQPTHLLQKLHFLQTSLTASTQKITQLQSQLKSLQKQLYNHGDMIQVQENRMMNMQDQIGDLKKDYRDKEREKEKERERVRKEEQKKGGVVTVPDFVREKLFIDLHSKYLGKFQITGNRITYIGEDKQATQLLSSKVFGQSNPNKTLKSTLHILKTHSKCLKFGIIDVSYSSHRSCWNYPHILYLHGWGHTMAQKHEQPHPYCDYGTGSTVEMQVDFMKGWIMWRIDGKREVVLKEHEKLIKSDVGWVGFIAMYDCWDAVEWMLWEGD